MKSKHLFILIIGGAIVSSLALGFAVRAAESDPSSLDEALRAGNIHDVLKILGPGESETDSAQPEVAPTPAPKGSDGTRHRITLVSGDGTVRDLSRISTETAPRAVRPGNAPPEAGGSSPTSTVTTVTVGPESPAADVGKPRRALPAAQPVQVPLTRPRQAEMSSAESKPAEPGKAESKTRVTTVTAPAGAMEAPEDRELASKELASLLKSMKQADPVEEAAAATSTASPVVTAVVPPVVDEDRKISKPLGEASRATSMVVPRPTVTGVSTPSWTLPAVASSSASVEDPMSSTRRQLDRLLQEAKQETFGAAAGSSTGVIETRSGTTSDGGWRYEGQWVEGRMDGLGVLTYPDGWRYDGEWRENVMMGQGTLYHPEGWQYTGEWRNGKMDGQGALIYPDGWKYVGDWRDGKMHGKGELIHPRNVATRTSR